VKRITDGDFNYTPSYSTDIKKRFDRIKREQAKAKPAAPNALVFNWPRNEKGISAATPEVSQCSPKGKSASRK
jgi:hypothetical protein